MLLLCCCDSLGIVVAVWYFTVVRLRTGMIATLSGSLIMTCWYKRDYFEVVELWSRVAKLSICLSSPSFIKAGNASMKIVKRLTLKRTLVVLFDRDAVLISTDVQNNPAIRVELALTLLLLTPGFLCIIIFFYVMNTLRNCFWYYLSVYHFSHATLHFCVTCEKKMYCLWGLPPKMHV